MDYLRQVMDLRHRIHAAVGVSLTPRPVTIALDRWWTHERSQRPLDADLEPDENGRCSSASGWPSSETDNAAGAFVVAG